MRLTFLIYCLGKFVQKIPRVFVRFLWDALDERDLCKESGMVSTSSRKIRKFTFHFILNGIFFFFTIDERGERNEEATCKKCVSRMISTSRIQFGIFSFLVRSLWQIIYWFPPPHEANREIITYQPGRKP